MEKISERKAFITVLAIFSMWQVAGSIDAAIALIGQAFSLSSAMTMYVSSIATLALSKEKQAGIGMRNFTFRDERIVRYTMRGRYLLMR